MQAEVNNIAENLNVTIHVLNNLFEEYQHTSRITLSNLGSVPIAYGNWMIYFYNFGIIEAERMLKNHTVLVADEKFQINHINGELYCLVPTTKFEAILPSKSTRIYLTDRGHMNLHSYAFPNWYVVGRGALPRIIKSTRGESLDFVDPLNTPAQWKAGKNDLYNPIKPLERYTGNSAVSSSPKYAKLVIPTPLRLTVQAVSGDQTQPLLQLERATWTITYDDVLRQEAEYLSGEDV